MSPTDSPAEPAESSSGGGDPGSSSGDSIARVSRLPLLIMSAVIVMLALLTLAILAGRSPASYPEGSPEAALQAFVTAVLDNDDEAVLALLTDEHRSRCRAEIDDEAVYGRRWSEGDVRAELEEMDVQGDEASAVVEFRNLDSDDPFGGSSWDREHRFTLVDTEDGWRVDRAEWPYSLERCTGGVN